MQQQHQQHPNLSNAFQSDIQQIFNEANKKKLISLKEACERCIKVAKYTADSILHVFMLGTEVLLVPHQHQHHVSSNSTTTNGTTSSSAPTASSSASTGSGVSHALSAALSATFGSASSIVSGSGNNSSSSAGHGSMVGGGGGGGGAFVTASPAGLLCLQGLGKLAGMNLLPLTKVETICDIFRQANTTRNEDVQMRMVQSTISLVSLCCAESSMAKNTSPPRSSHTTALGNKLTGGSETDASGTGVTSTTTSSQLKHNDDKMMEVTSPVVGLSRRDSVSFSCADTRALVVHPLSMIFVLLLTSNSPIVHAACSASITQTCHSILSQVKVCSSTASDDDDDDWEPEESSVADKANEDDQDVEDDSNMMMTMNPDLLEIRMIGVKLFKDMCALVSGVAPRWLTISHAELCGGSSENSANHPHSSTSSSATTAAAGTSTTTTTTTSTESREQLQLLLIEVLTSFISEGHLVSSPRQHHHSSRQNKRQQEQSSNPLLVQCLNEELVSLVLSIGSDMHHVSTELFSKLHRLGVQALIHVLPLMEHTAPAIIGQHTSIIANCATSPWHAATILTLWKRALTDSDFLKALIDSHDRNSRNSSAGGSGGGNFGNHSSSSHNITALVARSRSSSPHNNNGEENRTTVISSIAGLVLAASSALEEIVQTTCAHHLPGNSSFDDVGSVESGGSRQQQHQRVSPRKSGGGPGHGMMAAFTNSHHTGNTSFLSTTSSLGEQSRHHHHPAQQCVGLIIELITITTQSMCRILDATTLTSRKQQHTDKQSTSGDEKKMKKKNRTDTPTTTPSGGTTDNAVPHGGGMMKKVYKETLQVLSVPFLDSISISMRYLPGEEIGHGLIKAITHMIQCFCHDDNDDHDTGRGGGLAAERDAFLEILVRTVKQPKTTTTSYMKRNPSTGSISHGGSETLATTTIMTTTGATPGKDYGGNHSDNQGTLQREHGDSAGGSHSSLVVIDERELFSRRLQCLSCAVSLASGIGNALQTGWARVIACFLSVDDIHGELQRFARANKCNSSGSVVNHQGGQNTTGAIDLQISALISDVESIKEAIQYSFQASEFLSDSALVEMISQLVSQSTSTSSLKTAAPSSIPLGSLSAAQLETRGPPIHASSSSSSISRSAPILSAHWLLCTAQKNLSRIDLLWKDHICRFFISVVQDEQLCRLVGGMAAGGSCPVVDELSDLVIYVSTGNAVNGLFTSARHGGSSSSGGGSSGGAGRGVGGGPGNNNSSNHSGNTSTYAQHQDPSLVPGNNRSFNSVDSFSHPSSTAAEVETQLRPDQAFQLFLDVHSKACQEIIPSLALRQLHVILQNYGQQLFGSVWNPILEVLQAAAFSKSPDDVGFAFRTVEAVQHSFITNLCGDALYRMVLCVGAFITQVAAIDKININLSAVQIVWSLADFFVVSDSAHVSTKHWIALMLKICDGCWDVRQEIRHSSVKSLYSLILTHGAMLPPDAWGSCVWDVLLVNIENISVAAVRLSSQDKKRKLRQVPGTTTRRRDDDNYSNDDGNECDDDNGTITSSKAVTHLMSSPRQLDESRAVVVESTLRVVRLFYAELQENVQRLDDAIHCIIEFVAHCLLCYVPNGTSEEVSVAAGKAVGAFLKDMVPKGLSAVHIEETWEALEAVHVALLLGPPPSPSTTTVGGAEQEIRKNRNTKEENVIEYSLNHLSQNISATALDSQGQTLLSLSRQRDSYPNFNFGAYLHRYVGSCRCAARSSSVCTAFYYPSKPQQSFLTTLERMMTKRSETMGSEEEKLMATTTPTTARITTSSSSSSPFLLNSGDWQLIIEFILEELPSPEEVLSVCGNTSSTATVGDQEASHEPRRHQYSKTALKNVVAKHRHPGYLLKLISLLRTGLSVHLPASATPENNYHSQLLEAFGSSVVRAVGSILLMNIARCEVPVDLLTEVLMTMKTVVVDITFSSLHSVKNNNDEQEEEQNTNDESTSTDDVKRGKKARKEDLPKPCVGIKKKEVVINEFASFLLKCGELVHAVYDNHNNRKATNTAGGSSSSSGSDRDDDDRGDQAEQFDGKQVEDLVSTLCQTIDWVHEVLDRSVQAVSVECGKSGGGSDEGKKSKKRDDSGGQKYHQHSAKHHNSMCTASAALLSSLVPYSTISSPLFQQLCRRSWTEMSSWGGGGNRAAAIPTSSGASVDGEQTHHSISNNNNNNKGSRDLCKELQRVSRRTLVERARHVAHHYTLDAHSHELKNLLIGTLQEVANSIKTLPVSSDPVDDEEEEEGDRDLKRGIYPVLADLVIVEDIDVRKAVQVVMKRSLPPV